MKLSNIQEVNELIKLREELIALKTRGGLLPSDKTSLSNYEKRALGVFTTDANWYLGCSSEGIYGNIRKEVLATYKHAQDEVFKIMNEKAKRMLKIVDARLDELGVTIDE